MSTLAALALVVATSTTPRPLTSFEAELYREIATLDGEVRERDLRIRALTAERDEARARAERDQQRLLEGAPPAPERRFTLLEVGLVGAAAAAVGVLIGAIAL